MDICRGDIVAFFSLSAPEKTHTALVIQNDVGNRYSANTIVVPANFVIPEYFYPIQIHIPAEEVFGLNKALVIDTGIIFSISKDKIQERLGHCSLQFMNKVNEALKISLGIF